MKSPTQVAPSRNSTDSESLDELKKRTGATRDEYIEFLNKLLDDQTEQSKRCFEKLLEARRDQQLLGQRSSFVTGVLLGQVVMVILAFTTLRLAKLK